ncbi:MAG: bifunctional DNA-formamidopyrimidine glycosylase/DNA-(apurinic or apyrimidinic site) lyase [Betaproteobacteria bacterium]|nr:bifunctional DNA-formamidopyrimidine glycosylase/DNA-(apurinic or apyrimidinic site) lyase [Betaproteobacteria bacterium]
MPELPEVESFVRALGREYAGKKLARIEFHRPDLRFPFDTQKLKQIFASGSTFLAPQRVAKQMVLGTEKGWVAVSLGMSGAFIPSRHPQRETHEHLTLLFSDGAALGFVDPRRFGFWKPVSAFNEISEAVDPLQTQELQKLFKSKKFSESSRCIKVALMDQNIIGGIGNIYAVEALYRAGVSPLRTCSEVSPAKYKQLSQIIPEILTAAIDVGGSTVSTYRRLHGESGGFQELHLVYDRAGESCVNKKCRGKIERIVHAGRSSWWCPRCQK